VIETEDQFQERIFRFDASMEGIPMNELNPQQLPDGMGSNAHNPDTGNLFTVPQVARLLRLPVSWLYERTRRDAIPYHKLGKYVRFTQADLSAIVEMCPKGPKTVTGQGI
jgi:excisionase family DNA binding protein